MEPRIAMPRDSAGNLVPPDGVIANWIGFVPMGCVGTVGDIAPVTAFLASDAAGYITGGGFVVDGGYTAI
jgi:NAD(P)-dependent dehydrogenase (short-subunit alcohol dehydrogenase family)